MTREHVRPVEVHSHQYSAEGWCHGIFRDERGRPVALIEYANGELTRLDLDGAYHLKFKDSAFYV
jgi:hypothetical protein